MSKNTLKTAMEMVEVPRKPANPQPVVPVLEADRINAEIEAAERNHRAECERLREAGIALGERRRPACEAISKARALAQIVVNGRKHLAAANARAEAFTVAVASQFGGDGTDLGLLARLADNDPPGSTCERLAALIERWLAARELELQSELKEARTLAASAPDSAPLIEDVAQIEASLGGQN